MAEFQAAMSTPGTWSVGDNRFDEDGKNPKRLSFFLPLDSVHAFAQHLMNMADTPSLHKEGNTWDYQAQEKVRVQGIYLNMNGKEGSDGAFGNINPKKLEVAAEAPF
jgi:hypothetical protein